MMSPKRRLLLLSSSRLHGFEYLQYAKDDIKEFLNRSSVKNVLFIPYALTNYGAYTQVVRTAFSNLNLNFDIKGIHEGSDAVEEVKNADAIFIGGGNTFLLLETLYDKNLVSAIHHRVLEDGVPYIGSSAGTNVATVSINTTNDMPIVYPPTFNAINLVPFNINPHYQDADESSTHKGETREERINQYLEVAGSRQVLGLREGAILRVEGSKATLQGVQSAVLFRRNNPPQECPVGADLSELLKRNATLQE